MNRHLSSITEKLILAIGKIFDSDGMNFRHEILQEKSLILPSLTVKKYKKYTDRGLWRSPFENATITKSQKITIDHTVALKEAWISGACLWDEKKREDFFHSDQFGQLSLLTKKMNIKKGSKAPSSWLPDDPRWAEKFVYDWISIKHHWNLAADNKEWHFLSVFVGKDFLESFPSLNKPNYACN